MSRIYDTAAWQRLRAAKLSAEPLCEVCLRREVIEQADVVDHIRAIAAGGEPFPPLAGLMSMCASCHNIKTNAKDHPNASGFRRALKGFDVEGNPIDPEGWEPASGPRCASSGLSREPGGFASRRSEAKQPAIDKNVDLVSCDSFATSDKDDSRWV